MPSCLLLLACVGTTCRYLTLFIKHVQKSILAATPDNRPLSWRILLPLLELERAGIVLLPLQINSNMRSVFSHPRCLYSTLLL